MSIIESIKAREILDSRGNPTVEAEIHTKDGIFRASVPSGASTGTHEALELRDEDKTRYSGKGVLNAVEHINTLIADRIVGMDCREQEMIDKDILVLDGTENKAHLGANAILAVSMAACKAGAAAKKVPLYKHIANLADIDEFIIPVPAFNVINGGMHASNKLSMQEFMILPIGASSFKEALQMGAETYHILKNIIKQKFGLVAANVGDEGGFAPDIQDNEECLELIHQAIKKAGYSEKIKIAIDVAASEFFKKGEYDLDFKNPKNLGRMVKTGDEMIELYKEFIGKYELISIEDPFDQDDWNTYQKLTKEVGERIQIVGDDLLVTNPKRIEKAINEKTCNALLLKVNQIGTITEAVQACRLAQSAGWGVMVSHRSGETEDSFIADLAVGLRKSFLQVQVLQPGG